MKPRGPRVCLPVAIVLPLSYCCSALGVFVDRYIYIISAIFIYSSGIFVVCAISFSDHHLQDKTFRLFFFSACLEFPTKFCQKTFMSRFILLLGLSQKINGTLCEISSIRNQGCYLA